MTDRVKAYQATDDDLPDFIQGKAEAPAPADLERPLMPATPRKLERQLMAHERRTRKENREALDENRKIYIKIAKREQMLVWLLDLHNCTRLNDWERQFAFNLLAKFRKYKRVKWLTQKQYECLARMAAKYKAGPCQ